MCLSMLDGGAAAGPASFLVLFVIDVVVESTEFSVMYPFRWVLKYRPWILRVLLLYLLLFDGPVQEERLRRVDQDDVEHDKRELAAVVAGRHVGFL